MPQQEKILLFDGICNLCNGLVKFIIRHDREGKIKFATLQSQYAKEFLEAKFNGKSIPDSVVYTAEGKHYLRSAAILHLLKDMGKGWRYFYGFIIVPGFARDYIYDLIARSRYRIFGRRDSCMIPSADMMKRFVS